VAARLLPPGSSARGISRAVLDTYREGRNALRRYRAGRVATVEAPDYETWCALVAPTADESHTLHAAIEHTRNRRRVVVLVVGAGAVATADVATGQLWPHVSVERLRAPDDPGRLDAVGDDDMVMILRPGDRLSARATFSVADVLWEQPHLDLVSFDDDAPSATGGREPRFHPQWSPEVLWTANYLGRSFAIRGSVLKRLGFGEGADEDWWDLLLGADLDAGSTRHIPEVLLHLADRPAVSVDAAASLVARHARRRGLPVDVSTRHGVPRLDWRRESLPRVSVIVPTRHNRALLDVLVPSLHVTDYSSWELVVVDNGGELEGHAEWYEQRLAGLDARVIWWHEPFNYSAVNNRAAAEATGDVLVFLNDDTRIRSADWLTELAGWATHEPIGTAGVQLVEGQGLIQHGGVVLGMSGFADHLFAGLRPGAETMFGSTRWYRNGLANTAACVAVRRSVFDEVGGFDERFELVGSDVALGLACHRRGYRNVTTPMIDVDHLESLTRGTSVPTADMFTSYWWYQRWLRVGDPYYSPSLSLAGPEVRLRPPGEPTPLERIAAPLGRNFGIFRQQASEDEATMLAGLCRLDEADVRRIAATHASNAGYFPVRSVTWVLPDIENPFYGGLATALRIAETIRAQHGVENRFVFWSGASEQWMRSALAAIFPGLADSPMWFTDGSPDDRWDQVPDTDVLIATQWPTVYMAARFTRARRYAYLVQDFEPMFHPAGTLYALAEETYRLGFYGLCNTTSMARFYSEDYGGVALPFVPAVDRKVFHDKGRRTLGPGDPVRIFLYARPGHWRNCWELVSMALDELKARYGDGIEIVTAGSWARPHDLGRGITHLGLLDYESTGDLYRSVDIGISLTVSPHPSYLPLELMACGAAVVAFQLEPGGWILEQGSTAVLVRRTVDGLVDGISGLIEDPQHRALVAGGGTARIERSHSSWDGSLARVHAMLSEPEQFGWS
jgi:GT2 family glycosyltransferase/glycosyltransferase involved in cell wall biosynthesis